MIVVLGAFDGYHRGHQRLLVRASALAEREGVPWSVVSFTPHPRWVLSGGQMPLLFTDEEKECIAAFLGIPRVHSLLFSPDLSSMAPEEFFQYLDSHIGLSGVVVGHDFRFGRARLGNPEVLQKLCRMRGIPLEVVSPFKLEGTVVSSTGIRDLLLRGDVYRVRTFLGYPFFMTCSVIKGRGRGRSMAVPTANLKVPESKALPASGVYAGKAIVDERISAAAISVGINPTFGDVTVPQVEVHLVDFDGDLYDRWLTVFLYHRLRAIQRFDDPGCLSRQIRLDVEQTRRLFQSENDEEMPVFWLCRRFLPQNGGLFLTTRHR